MTKPPSLVEIEVDDALRADARRTLAAEADLAPSVRAVLGRIAAEDALADLPPALRGPADPDACDAWFRAKVREALDDPRPGLSHEAVMRSTQAIIDRARAARAWVVARGRRGS